MGIYNFNLLVRSSESELNIIFVSPCVKLRSACMVVMSSTSLWCYFILCDSCPCSQGSGKVVVVDTVFVRSFFWWYFACAEYLICSRSFDEIALTSM